MNTSDESSTELVCTKSWHHLKEIIANLQLQSKRSKACDFCDLTRIVMKNLHDFFRIYSMALSCVTHHTNECDNVPVVSLFYVDNVILDVLIEEKTHDISAILSYTRHACDEYNEALVQQLIALYKTFFSEETIKINCEQEVESLFYKFYKKSKLSNPLDIELLLVVLYRRGEFSRFFKVFEKHQKTFGGFRLAILSTMNNECQISTNRVLAELKKTVHAERSYLVDSTSGMAQPSELQLTQFNDQKLFESTAELELQDLCISEKYSGSHSSDLNNLLEVQYLVKMRKYFKERDHVDIDDWVEEIKAKKSWEECIETWKTHRTDNTGAVDNSMIDLCIKNEFYEDGWLIYEHNTHHNPHNVHKACTLCMNALKVTGNSIWVSRIIRVAEKAITANESEACCEIIDDILSKLGDIHDSNRNLLLESFLERIHVLEDREEIVCCLVRGLLLLCTKCSNTDTCDMCVRYATRVYTQWKQMKRDKFSFFKKKKKYNSEIYNSMLGVCDVAKDCEGFYTVCRDLLKDETEINREICHKLQNFHNKTCKNCDFRKNQVVETKDGRNLMMHFIKKC